MHSTCRLFLLLPTCVNTVVYHSQRSGLNKVYKLMRKWISIDWLKLGCNFGAEISAHWLAWRWWAPVWKSFLHWFCLTISVDDDELTVDMRSSFRHIFVRRQLKDKWLWGLVSCEAMQILCHIQPTYDRFDHFGHVPYILTHSEWYCLSFQSSIEI
jgi:hypothetical protein